MRRLVLLLLVASAACGGASPKPSSTAAEAKPAKPVIDPATRLRHQSLAHRVDNLRAKHLRHIDKLRRYDGCGVHICAKLTDLADTLLAHRRLTALQAACRDLEKERTLFVGYALKPGMQTPAARQDDASRDRVVDCRLVRDGERILQVQLATTATWEARLGHDVITAAERYEKQGWISGHLAERLRSLGRERRLVRDRLAPIFARTGVRVPDDELFAAAGDATERFDKAVADAAKERWNAPVIADPSFEKAVRAQFPTAARARGVEYRRIVEIGVRSKRWQVYVDDRGKPVRATRLAEVVIEATNRDLCVHRLVVMHRRYKGAARKPTLAITEDVRFSRCKLPEKPEDPGQKPPAKPPKSLTVLQPA